MKTTNRIKIMKIILNTSIFVLLLVPVWSQSWTEITTTGSNPTTRIGHISVYDSNNNRMIVFGGASSFFYLNDIWVLSNANGLGGTPSWTQLTTTGTAIQPRISRSGVYDPYTNRLIVFGGFDNTSNPYNDVWYLDQANGLGGTPSWTEITTSGTIPSERTTHTAVYDTTNNRMIIFGGKSYGDELNDCWVLSYANNSGGTPTWTEITTTGSSPTTRLVHSAVYDSFNNCMIIFGGTGAMNYFNDVWVLSHANGLGGTPSWSELTASGTLPLQRYAHSAVYDPLSNRMTIFGGEDYNTDWVNDIWTLTHANGLGGIPTWSEITVSSSEPTGRIGATAIYDPISNRMTIFGGREDFPIYKNDTWVLDMANGLPVELSVFYTE